MGQGKGSISTTSSLVGKLFGLADSMQDKNFGAYVDTAFNPVTNAFEQKWIRIFS
jgi:hypothetical protein